MGHVEGESRLLVQEIMDLVKNLQKKKYFLFHPIEMMTCQDRVKILQKNFQYILSYKNDV